MGVSLKPCDAVEGGGLLDNEDVKVTESRFAMFDYGGKAQPVPAIMWKLDRMDGSAQVIQYWSIGKSTDWMPSDDGKELLPIGKVTELVSSSNGMLLLSSLVNAGLSESKLGEDISIFDGMECHVNRVAAPTRKGMVNQKENATVLIVSKIHKLPWEKSTKSGSKTTKPKSGSKTAKPGKDTTEDKEVDIEALATEFVLGILSDGDKMLSTYPDGIPKAKLAPEAFAAFPQKDPNRSAIVQILFKDEFLKTGPWKYEGGKISIG
jgi:hypothetical protein